MISPSWGFSLAVSGRTIPLLVISSRALGLMTTRSPSARSFVAVALANVLSSCFGQGRPRASDSRVIDGRVMAGWSDDPRNLSWHRVGLGPNPSACVSSDFERAGFSVLWHSPSESAKRLPNRGSGCQPARDDRAASAAGSEVERQLDRLDASGRGRAARPVVAGIPAELPLGFVVQDEMAEASGRVGDDELAWAVVGELADVVLERHPAEDDLERVLALEVDRETAGRTGERWRGDIERPRCGPLRFERPVTEAESDDIAAG